MPDCNSTFFELPTSTLIFATVVVGAHIVPAGAGLSVQFSSTLLCISWSNLKPLLQHMYDMLQFVAIELLQKQ